MKLMERLVLAAINSKNNRLYQSRTFIKYGLAGIAIIELIRKEKLILEGEKIIIKDSTPTRDTILDEVLNAIKISTSPKKIGSWMTALQMKVRGLDTKVIYALEDSGYLRIDEKRFLGLFPIKQYIITNEDVQMKNIQYIKTALFGEITNIEEDAVILVTIANSCGFMKKQLIEEEKKSSKERLKTISKQTFYSFKNEAVLKTLKAVNRAINNAKSASY